MGSFCKKITHFCCCCCRCFPCCKLGSTVSSQVHHTTSSQYIPKLALPETRRLTAPDTPRATPPNAPRVSPPDTPRQTTPDTPSSQITSITLETEPKYFNLTIQDIYPGEPSEIVTTVIYPFEESLLVKSKEREYRILTNVGKFSPLMNQSVISASDREKRNNKLPLLTDKPVREPRSEDEIGELWF